MIISPEDIIRKAQKFLKEGNKPQSAFTALGMAYFEKGLLDKAVFYYSKALESDSQFAPAYAGLGIVFGKKGLVKESVFNLKEAIKLSPNCALLYNWLADAYFDQGKIEDAIREYSKATELDSLDSNAHNDLADAYRIKGDFQSALNYYRKTLEIDPDDSNAKIEMAQVLIQMKECEEAKKILNSVINDHPLSEDCRTSKVILASLLIREGDYPAARNLLTEISDCFPFNPTIHFHLALCQIILEEPQKAMENLNKTLDLDPNHARARRLIQQISVKRK
ncbi:MAG: tetratricopeptide repeat protein [Candidatus Riflebacteria bacterium]|nr:tetratricopeptide repeat protein [Candidatus Riflebacteria bacterium]